MFKSLNPCLHGTHYLMFEHSGSLYSHPPPSANPAVAITSQYHARHKEMAGGATSENLGVCPRGRYEIFKQAGVLDPAKVGMEEQAKRRTDGAGCGGKPERVKGREYCVITPHPGIIQGSSWPQRTSIICLPTGFAGIASKSLIPYQFLLCPCSIAARTSLVFGSAVSSHRWAFH
jgi:hypothetical protein